MTVLASVLALALGLFIGLALGLITKGINIHHHTHAPLPKTEQNLPEPTKSSVNVGLADENMIEYAQKHHGRIEF